MYLSIYQSINLYLYLSIYIYLYLSISVYLYLYLYLFIYLSIYLSIFLSKCIYLHTCIYIYVYVCMYIYKYIYIYVCIMRRLDCARQSPASRVGRVLGLAEYSDSPTHAINHRLSHTALTFWRGALQISGAVRRRVQTWRLSDSPPVWLLGCKTETLFGRLTDWIHVTYCNS